jgi:uncharacterized Tic20 family protein
MIVVPISFGYEKCPSCEMVLYGFSPAFGNSIGSPLLFCRKCKKECISYQKREWLFFSIYNKLLHLCNVVLFSIGLGVFSSGIGLIIADKIRDNISFRILLYIFISTTAFYLFISLFSIIRSVRRTRDADYIFRLHRANALRTDRISIVGVLGLCFIAVALMAMMIAHHL